MAETARSSRFSSIDRAPTKAKSASTAKARTAKARVATKPVLASMKAGVATTATASAAPARPLARSAMSTPPPPPKPAEPEAPKRVSGIVPKGYVPLVTIPPLPPPPKNLKLAVGDKAVHPAHGLGEVTAIEHREIGGAKGEFYILRMLDNGMRVMVPKTAAQAAGLRPVMSAKEAEKVFDTMRAREVAVDLQPWSRRFRAYTEMIKCGSPHEVAKVLRDMYRLKFDKDLSFGERRLLDQAKSLLMKELAAAKGMTEAALQAHVDEMFRN